MGKSEWINQFEAFPIPQVNAGDQWKYYLATMELAGAILPVEPYPNTIAICDIIGQPNDYGAYDWGTPSNTAIYSLLDYSLGETLLNDCIANGILWVQPPDKQILSPVTNYYTDSQNAAYTYIQQYFEYKIANQINATNGLYKTSIGAEHHGQYYTSLVAQYLNLFQTTMSIADKTNNPTLHTQAKTAYDNMLAGLENHMYNSGTGHFTDRNSGYSELHSQNIYELSLLPYVTPTQAQNIYNYWKTTLASSGLKGYSMNGILYYDFSGWTNAVSKEISPVPNYTVLEALQWYSQTYGDSTLLNMFKEDLLTMSYNADYGGLTQFKVPWSGMLVCAVVLQPQGLYIQTVTDF